MISVERKAFFVEKIVHHCLPVLLYYQYKIIFMSLYLGFNKSETFTSPTRKIKVQLYFEIYGQNKVGLDVPLSSDFSTIFLYAFLLSNQLLSFGFFLLSSSYQIVFCYLKCCSDSPNEGHEFWP